MTGREGHTQASKLIRQEQVYKLFLRGVTPQEIAKHFDITDRTVERDVGEIKANLMETVLAQDLRSLKLAYAELRELWRETWVLYHRPSREVPMKRGDRIVMAKEDDRPIKIRLLTELRGISAEMNRLIFPQGPTATPPTGAPSPEQAVADLIKTLPESLRKEIIAEIERNSNTLENDP